MALSARRYICPVVISALVALPGSYAYSATSVSPAVRALVDGERNPLAPLVEMGPGVVPEVIAALKALTDEQVSLPADSTARRDALERRRIQLYDVIGTLGSAEHAAELISVTRMSLPRSFAFLRCGDALDQMHASSEADRFAIELAGRNDASGAMLMMAFVRFSHRPAPQVVQAAAERSLTSRNNFLRDQAIRVLGSAGRTERVRSAYLEILQKEPTNLSDVVLAALAEAVKPAEFAKLTTDKGLQPHMLTDAARINKLFWSDGKDKSPDLSGYRSEENQTAVLRYILKGQRTELLERVGIRIYPDYPDRVSIAPDQRIWIARLGYELSASNGKIVITKRS
jgi:hypothetical protein